MFIYLCLSSYVNFANQLTCLQNQIFIFSRYFSWFQPYSLFFLLFAFVSKLKVFSRGYSLTWNLIHFLKKLYCFHQRSSEILFFYQKFCTTFQGVICHSNFLTYNFCHYYLEFWFHRSTCTSHKACCPPTPRHWHR